MSRCKAIKFRHLAAQLTRFETVQFVEQLLNTANANDIIMKALFNLFIQSSGDQYVETINDLLSNIIQSRKKKPKTVVLTREIKLDGLPKALIGVTASFLQQTDYINFSTSNRCIYLGCNSPNLMHHLDLTEIKDYSSINLALYPSIKNLELDLNKINELKSNAPINQLKSITLLERNEQINSEVDIDQFIAQTRINTDNIQELSCVGNMHSFTTDKFTKLLAKFPNIQYLHLVRVRSDIIDANQIKKIYPNLRDLFCIVLPDNPLLIHIFGDKVKALSFAQFTESNYNLSNINFSNLQNLRICVPSLKTINDILKTAINLKYMVMIMHTEKMNMTASEAEEAMINVMTKCKSLEYIKITFINGANGCKSIRPSLEGIEKGLFKTKKRERKIMKIRIDIDMEMDRAFLPQTFTVNIGNIIHWCQQSKINDFMFIMNVRDLGDNEIADAFMEELKDLSSNIKVHKYGSMFVITNCNCRINGYC